MFKKPKYDWLVWQALILGIAWYFNWRVTQYNEMLLLSRIAHEEALSWGYAHILTSEYWLYFLGTFFGACLIILFIRKAWESLLDVDWLLLGIVILSSVYLLITMAQNLTEAMIAVLFFGVVAIVIRVLK